MPELGKLSRRSALGGAAVAGVASSLPANLMAATKDKPIDVCFISEPTASHRTGFLRALRDCSGVRKVSVADHTGKTLAESKEVLGERFGKGYRDQKLMLRAANPALTVITTEGHRAPAAIEAALRVKSHVLTDKPSCVKLVDFERLATLADTQQRQIMLAMATRSSAAVKKARQLIAAGMLGKPYAATMDWIADQTRLKSPAYHKSWLSFKNLAGGGKLIFHGIHYLDVIQHLMADSIRAITGFCHNVGGQPIEVEDAAVVTFKFRSGMLGTLNTGYYLDRGKQTQIRIWGSLGWMHLDLIARKPVEWYSTHADAPRGVQQFRYVDKGGLYQLFFQDVIDAVVRQTAVPITTRESLSALRVVFGGYRAATTGKTQSL